MSFAGDGQYYGLSGERPTAGIGSGTKFIDRGTGVESYWNGSIWLDSPRSITSGSQITGTISGSPTFAGNVAFSGNITLAKNIAIPYTVGIFKRGATVYAQDYQGIIVASGVAGIGVSSGGDDHKVISSGIAYVPIGVGGSVFFADPPFYMDRPGLLKDYVRLYANTDRITNSLSGATFVAANGLLSGEPMLYDTNFNSGSLTAIRMEGLSFNGFDDTRDGVKAAFDRGTISNCNFEDCRISIDITKAGSFANEGNRIYNNIIVRGERAITIAASSTSIQNNLIGRMGKDCIRQTFGFSLKVIGNKIYEAAMSGTGFNLIEATSANYTEIIGNDLDVDRAECNGVVVFSTDSTIIQGNRFKGPTSGGRNVVMLQSGSKYNLVMGNIVAHSGGPGIAGFSEQSGSSNNFFIYNIFSDEAGFPGGYYLLRSNTSKVIDASGMMVGAGAPGQFVNSGRQVFSNIVNYNASGAIATTASGVNTNSGFFNPRGFYTMQISGVDRKVPFFD